jgi:hypothetical protein
MFLMGGLSIPPPHLQQDDDGSNITSCNSEQVPREAHALVDNAADSQTLSASTH